MNVEFGRHALIIFRQRGPIPVKDGPILPVRRRFVVIFKRGALPTGMTRHGVCCKMIFDNETFEERTGKR